MASFACGSKLGLRPQTVSVFIAKPARIQRENQVVLQIVCCTDIPDRHAADEAVIIVGAAGRKLQKRSAGLPVLLTAKRHG